MVVTDLAHASAELALWLGVALLAAKLGAEFAERVLRQPAVVGELLAGMIVGPYALGGWDIGGFGSLFPHPDPGALGVPAPLWLFGQIAAVILLFGAGLTTDFRTFIRYAPSATGVAIGGVIIPFVMGALVAVAGGLVPDPFHPEALFIGAILTATSVGVTARVLGDVGKLDTPEGATILGAAVIDDVIGVLVLALVVAAGGVDGATQDLGMLAIRTIGLWLGLSALLILAAVPMGKSIRGLRTAGATVAIATALALLAGWVAESVGLAMIIGSYSAGLALSRSPLRRQLEPEVRSVGHVLIPVFFVAMGMLVDYRAVEPVLGIGLVLTFLAGLGKVIGGGIPALLTGFTPVGALRVGVGMVPRGEVALVVAGIGLANGIIPASLFGVAVMIAILTTVVTPFPLVLAFRLKGEGTRNAPTRPPQQGSVHSFSVPLGLGVLFETELRGAMERAGFTARGSWTDARGSRGTEWNRDGRIVSVVLREELDQRVVDLESEGPVTDLAAILADAADATTATVATVLRDARDVPELPATPA